MITNEHVVRYNNEMKFCRDSSSSHKCVDCATHRLSCDTGKRIMRHYSKLSIVGLEVVSEPYSKSQETFVYRGTEITSILRRPTASNELKAQILRQL